ncbi:hypothetical protein Poly24_40510 [Rosistilla carotiformis]|uniref:Uncharacterized protein n=1 Tax=Rosistilla carotiformis TaxID=2528017 RepID=A0A518JXR2_9BACT|nr:hypothetical protein [Rosistilla carotiformis]QDV70330.1 hypothetical protein Poly24_40510 [Rosistilla carotiformis]
MLSLFRKSKKPSESTRRKQQARRRLRAECLEDRRLLAGVVNVDTTVFGDLTLDGNVSSNQIAVHGTAVPGQFVIEGENGTLLTLDGGAQTFSSLTVNGITDDIIVDLGHGDDIFTLGDNSNPTEIGQNLIITNRDDDTNILRNVDIGEDLLISRTDIAYSELQIDGSIIRNNVDIDNNVGDTKTEISDSEIEGTLIIVNGNGDDVTVVDATSIGSAQFFRPGGPGTPADPVVSITNGNGSSLTSFTSANDPDTTGFLPTGTLSRPTIYGGINIVNGDQLPPGLIVAPPTAGGATPSSLSVAVDIVVFNQADVLGHLDIENFDGHTETVIVDSNIGTDNKARDTVVPINGGYGDAVTIANGNGFDLFLSQNSTMQYGLSLNNGTGNWGSQTDIRDSEIGGRDTGSLGVDAAIFFVGDNGDDVFNVSDTTSGSTFDGMVILEFNNGEDHVQFMGVASQLELDMLDINFGAGDDLLYMENVEVKSMVKVLFLAGTDTLELRDNVDFPPGLLGTIEIDGGAGADFYHVDNVMIPFINFDTLIP